MYPHTNSTPATAEPTQAIGRGTVLGAGLTARARGEVPLNPVVFVLHFGPFGVRGTLLAVVKGHLFATVVGIVLAHYKQR